MKTIEDVIKQISKNLNIDKQIVNDVCKHVFTETVKTMKSDDTKDILFNELFKFKLKKRYKEDKNRQYSK